MWNTDAKYTIVPTSKFKKHYAEYIKNGFNIDELDEIINMLANGEHLGREYHDHPLKGRLQGFRGCHVRPDWVLIYKRTDKEWLETLNLLFHVATNSFATGKEKAFCRCKRCSATVPHTGVALLARGV